MAAEGQLWEVVGGVDKGGIVVREGQDVATPMMPERISTGALVREVALHGERLNYEKVSGVGPSTGWVSIALKDGKPLMARRESPATAVAAPTLAGGAPRGHFPPVTGRKMRVLAMHGCPGNSSIMKFMCNTLKSLAGSDVEWIFVDGPCPWAPIPGSKNPKSMEQSDFAKRIAGKTPFTSWYEHPEDADVLNPGMNVLKTVEHRYKMRRRDTGDLVGITPYTRVEEGLEYLDACMAREAPIDVAVAYSQAGTMLGIYMEHLRKAGRMAPWRLNVLFCGAMIDDPEYQLSEMSPLPTVYVVGGASDAWCETGKKLLPLMYSDLTIMEHSDGHVLPTTQPLAGEIYTRVMREMRSICGLPAAAEKK